MSVEEVEQLLETRRAEMLHSVLGSDVNPSRNGLVDTLRGQMLTSFTAMNLEEEKYGNDEPLKLTEEPKAAELSRRKTRCIERAKAEAEKFRNAR